MGEVYRPIEGPKGEIGFYLVSDGSPRPLRLPRPSALLINPQALPKIREGRGSWRILGRDTRQH